MPSAYNMKSKNYEPNPCAIWLYAYKQQPGDIELSNQITWGTAHSLISHIIIKTKSTNWDMYICEEREENDETRGTAMAWGQNNNGQLGTGDIVDYSSPVLVLGSHNFVHVAKGLYLSSHSCALKEDGSAWAWGNNSSGQLGNNTGTNTSSPISVVGNHSFVQISVGGDHTVALKENGSVWAWGLNNCGQLGTGNTTNYSSPVMIITEHSFKTIDAGNSFSAALTNDGSVYTWGSGKYGAIGNNDVQNKSTPTPVIGGHSFVSMSVGSYFMRGLKEDGSTWAWGYNENGRLGDGTTNNRSSPVSTIGEHSFIQIIGQGAFSLALKNDGSAWTWGRNTYGALGDGTLNDKSSPVSVIGGHSFIAIAGSTDSGMALKENGSVWTWGYNNYGQLGDGTKTNKSSPISILGDYKFYKINGYSFHAIGLLGEPANKITTTKIASNKIGNACIQINSSFNSSANKVFLRYIDRSGNNPCDIYLLGEKRGGLKKCKPGINSLAEQSHPLMQDISGLWLFNEGDGTTVHDYSGNERHGTIGTLGGPTGAIWTTGESGIRLRFPGNAAAAVSVADAMSLFGSSTFSIASIYNGDDDIVDYAGLYEVYPDGNQRMEFEPFMVTKCIFTVGPASGDITTDHEARITMPNLEEDAYTVCIYNEANYRKIFSTTESQTSISNAARPTYSGLPFSIGKRQYTNSPFKGTIEFLVVWKRVLSVDEIAYLEEYPWCMFKGHSGY
jgi:alpha-tubulin suppressor-like RCC1 family protein